METLSKINLTMVTVHFLLCNFFTCPIILFLSPNFNIVRNDGSKQNNDNYNFFYIKLLNTDAFLSSLRKFKLSNSYYFSVNSILRNGKPHILKEYKQIPFFNLLLKKSELSKFLYKMIQTSFQNK